MSVSSPIIPDRRTRVFVRRAVDGAVVADGSADNDALWTADDSLLAAEVHWQMGPDAGYAKLTAVPDVLGLGGTQRQSVEDLLAGMSVDDQVRIVLYGADDPLDPTPDGGLTLFDGVLSRAVFELSAAADGGEAAAVVAEPSCALDNVGPAHVIDGRWIPDLTLGQPRRIDAPGLPVCFNFEGRPNMFTPAAGGAATAIGAVATFAQDGYGAPWTVGHALAAVLGRWLYGPLTAPSPRFSGAATSLLDALVGYVATGADATGLGLGAVLDEVDVTAMGALDAVAAICAAAGLRMAMLAGAQHAGACDRPWQLTIWPANRGVAKALYLAKRGTTYADAAAAAAANNVAQCRALLDSREVRNDIVGVGRCLIECTLPLAPLWDPALAWPDDPADTMIDPPEGWPNVADGYHARHVVGGPLFATYGHVGRRWGVDCDGAAVGYSSGPYALSGQPFDFVAYLGLDGVGAGGSGPATALLAQRAARGVSEPIVWLPRPRPAQRLHERTDGSAWSASLPPLLLEVSTDSGATWRRCDAPLRSRTDMLAIELQIPNLAAMTPHGEALAAEDARVADSWWGLIDAATLRLRLTCVIEADHAARVHAPRRSTSGSGYSRRQVYQTPLVERWIAGQASTNDAIVAGTWYLVDGPAGSLPLDAATAARRAALESQRVSAAAEHLDLDPGRYRLGDRITGISGRGLGFGVGGGGGVLYPDLIGLTLTLAPAGGQRMQMHLEDLDMSRSTRRRRHLAPVRGGG